MTVYVDDMKAPYRGMVMCHMIADTRAELLAMADRIGVQRRWLQDPQAKPHFDIALAKRALAVRHGAREITLRQCAAMSMFRLYTAVARKVAIDDVPLPAPEVSEALLVELRAQRASAS